MAACTDTSSADVGSSQTTTSGRGPKARAIATRCFRPPDSWPGRSARWRSSSRTEAISSASRSRSAVPESPASRVSGRLIRLRTECRRFSAESGFWNTICSARRVSRGRRRASGLSGLPSRVTTEPWSGAVSPSRTRASVVLPLPDSPTRPSVSPRCTARSTPASAWTPPGKVFESLSTTTSGPPMPSVARAGAEDGVARGSSGACSW